MNFRPIGVKLIFLFDVRGRVLLDLELCCLKLVVEIGNTHLHAVTVAQPRQCAAGVVGNSPISAMVTDLDT